jgi:histone arginine demethylase JMJD6
MQLAVDEIDRRAGLSPEQFAREYADPLRPAVLTDAIDRWAALGKWTPQFFRERYGHLEVAVDGERMALRELIDRVEASSEEEPGPYLRNQSLAEWPPELFGDVVPMPACTRPNWLESRFFPSRHAMTYVEVYIGGPGARFPVLHWDGLHTHAWLMQLHGDKEYIVFPPDQTPLMYPTEQDGNRSEVDDVLDPDLEAFPRFGDAVGSRFQLHPGETLFVPSGWWHTARILTPSVTVSINAVNRANGEAFSRDYVEMIAHRSALAGKAVASYLRLGRRTRLFEPNFDRPRLR